MLTNHSGSPAVAAELPRTRACKLLAYQSDMRKFAPNAQLASVTQHWGALLHAGGRRRDRWNLEAAAVWGGMRDGMVQLSPLSPSLPSRVVQAVEMRRDDIVAARFHPFSGRLVDQSGHVRQAAGTMSDDKIAAMDWFVQGVTGTLP